MDENIEKGKSGELFVSALATKTFFSYWCFENPYEATLKGKEICDLLVLFRGTCIIWQIKNYTFKESHDRYFNKTVKKGCDQISGAERKLYESNKPVTFKYGVEGNLFTFDPLEYPTCIRVVVHLGEGYQYQTLGKILAASGKFVHVLGRLDFEMVIKELYTITDFLDYLNAREQLAMREPLIIGGTEKDIVGLYLVMKERFYDSDIFNNKKRKLILDFEGCWDQYNSLKSANENVLLEVEDLIGRFVQSDLVKSMESKSLAEDLLTLNRRDRRVFAASFLSFIRLCSDSVLKNIAKRFMEIGNLGFVFFYYSEFLNRDQIPAYMHLAAEGYSYFTSYRVKKIVVVGINDRDQISFIAADFTKNEIQNEEELKLLLDSLGWFQHDQISEFEIKL